MKLTQIKLANSVKMKNEELFYFNNREKDVVTASCGHDITLENGVIVRIKNRRTSEEVCTSLMNAVWWTEEKKLAKAKVEKASK